MYLDLNKGPAYYDSEPYSEMLMEIMKMTDPSIKKGENR